MKKLLILGALILLPGEVWIAAAADKSADEPVKEKRAPRRRVRLGGIMVSAGYSHYSGRTYPYYYPYWGYRPSAWGWSSPWYGPYWFDPLAMSPFVHPGFYTGFPYGPNMGEVRLKTTARDADVYLDGALAGKAAKLKTIWLEPGAYHLELRAGGLRPFTQKIYVLSGKRLDVIPVMNAKEVEP